MGVRPRCPKALISHHVKSVSEENREQRDCSAGASAKTMQRWGQEKRKIEAVSNASNSDVKSDS